MPAPTPVKDLIQRDLLLFAPYGSYQERVELFENFLQAAVGHLGNLDGLGTGVGVVDDDDHPRDVRPVTVLVRSYPQEVPAT